MQSQNYTEIIPQIYSNFKPNAMRFLFNNLKYTEYISKFHIKFSYHKTVAPSEPQRPLSWCLAED